MCYYHPTSLLYAPSIPHQYFVRPCRHAKFHATQMAYLVSSGSTAGSPNANIVSMQRSYGILVRPCSSHHIADEGEDGGEGDICMDVPFGFDFDSQEEDDDEKCEGYEDEEESEDEEEESDEDEESDDEDEDEDEDNDEKEGYARTGLAISVPITSIQPGSGPSLRDIKPKPQSKRFKRDLISMPVQYLRMKWKRSMALRYIQKRAADATAASVSAGPQRPQIFNNNGFGSWYAPAPVQTQAQTQTIGQGQGQGQGQSPRFNPWDTLSSAL